MSTLAENIQQAIEDFDAVENAIKSFNIPVPTGTPTSSYGNLVRSIYPAKIYGVSGLAATTGSTASLTRTDDAVGKTYSINTSTGAITSDFNDLFPWNETTIVNDTAGKFVRFPKMFFRIETADSSQRLKSVAVAKYPSGAGNWFEVAPFMYGCYGGSLSDGKLKSVSGVERTGFKTRAEFRAAAAENGTAYYQLDLYHRTVLTFLWWIEFATKNSASIMTGRVLNAGTSGGNSKRNTGGTNLVTTPSGFETAYGQMRYHYIEDFVGNMMEFVEGVCCGAAGGYDKVTATPSQFSDDGAQMLALSYAAPSNGLIKAFGWDNSKPFLCMPIETGGTDFTTFFCDSVENADANNPVLYCGARYGSNSDTTGLTHFYKNTVDNNSAVRGGRLMKAVT